MVFDCDCREERFMKQAKERGVDVLCAGIVVADVMAKAIDEVPAWDHLGTFDHIEHHIGGCAVNTAVDLAHLGAWVKVCACVGNDGAGMFIRRRLEDEGVPASGLVEAEGVATSYTFVMIGSDGRRRYLHHVGANARFQENDVPDALLADARMLHVGGAFLMPGMDGAPTARLLERAKNLGLTTSMDTAFNPRVDAAALVKPCLPWLDIFIPSVEEASAITGATEPEAMLDWFSGHDIGVLGIKLGARGAVLRSGGETRYYPVFPVDVVDGSGAGDAFYAGFLHGVCQGWAVDMCAQFANATAAHCIQAVGCSAGVPDAAAVQRFIDEHTH
jgi:sugar/nucleoside kinase (ribokinase family)